MEGPYRKLLSSVFESATMVLHEEVRSVKAVTLVQRGHSPLQRNLPIEKRAGLGGVIHIARYALGLQRKICNGSLRESVGEHHDADDKLGVVVE